MLLKKHSYPVLNYLHTGLSVFSIILLFIGLYGCSSDNSSPEETAPPMLFDPELGINKSYEVARCKSLSISPDFETNTATNFKWTVVRKNGIAKDSIISQEKNLDFISLYEGEYQLKLEVVKNQKTQITETAIKVKKETTLYSAYLSKVYDFLPAYGQFINTLPIYNAGDTREMIIAKAETAIKGEKGTIINLGGFGGYVIFGFDHTVVNIPEKRDFRVLGNGFTNLSEPGVIMVAYDKNKNGKPDPEEWYEIAGSEHNNPKTIKNYEITYYKPDPSKEEGIQQEYIRWTDNQGNNGYKIKNSSHTQSYYPSWVSADRISFSGTLLPTNAVDENGQGTSWKLSNFEFGYADNVANSNTESAIDISWAIDKNGDKVNLIGIDFIKVYTGVNQEAGWLGETSTEVSGAEDLHLLKQNIPTRK